MQRLDITQLFIIALIKIIGLYLGDVTVECVSCANRVSELSGVVGGKITIRYTFKYPFTKLLINYKGIQNTFAIGPFNNKVNTDKVTDKRFIIPIIISGTGNTRSMEITLTKLSLHDNNLTFDYIYTDANITDHPGSNTLKVYGRYFMLSMLCFISLIKS